MTNTFLTEKLFCDVTNKILAWQKMDETETELERQIRGRQKWRRTISTTTTTTATTTATTTTTATRNSILELSKFYFFYLVRFFAFFCLFFQQKCFVKNTKTLHPQNVERELVEQIEFSELLNFIF